jgi:hypothetical protein
MTASSRSEPLDDLVERGLELLRAGGRASGRNRDAMLAQVARIRRLLLQREFRLSREPANERSED